MEADGTLRDLGWPGIVEAWAERCRTSEGAAAVRALPPCASRSAAAERAAEVQEARLLANGGQPMSFGGVRDVRAAVLSARKGGSLDAEQLVAVADTARGYGRLRRRLEEQRADVPALWKRGERIGDFDELGELLLAAFEPDGRVADHASPALGALRRKLARLRVELESRARSLLQDDRIAGELQEDYWTQRDDRYVLLVRASSRSKVPGIVHGRSGSGQTVFIEPQQLVEAGNELRLAEDEERQEVLRILAELSARVAEDADALLRTADVVAELDVLGAAARLASDLQATPPTFCEAERTLDLRRLRHPLMLLAKRACVPSDVTLERGRVLVVSGPNAGGKTVALKSVGLAALMSRFGLHILAAEDSRIPWFDEVRAAIGDAQSLESELSTFSAHLELLREFLAEAHERSLVLIDEICSATEPEQGGALAQAVMEAFAERQVTALVTTHYERLKLLATEDERFANASVGFDLERMAPTFRLHVGVPGASAAIDVARRMGIPEPVSTRARELVGAGRAEMDQLLRDVAAERARLMDEREALREEREATARAYEETRSARLELEAKERSLHEKQHAGALGALRDARHELDRVKRVIKRSPPGDAARLHDSKREIERIATVVHEAAPAREAPAGKAPRPDELAVGSAVSVPALGGEGVVLEPPRRGKVLVQVGLVKSKIAVEQLRAASPSGNRAEAKPSRPRAQARPVPREDTRDGPVRTPDATLDLRGERVLDAIARVDRFVDQSLVSDREAIFIVHGHGTGALRESVREHLDTHASVRRWRSGGDREGGEGVTVAWLDR